MKIPSLQIRQQYARLGIDADLGRYDMKQPRATFEMNTTPPKLEIQSPRGQLEIDQSRAWDALGVGGTLLMMNRIYSEASNVALQGVARIAQKGDRLAAIHQGTDAIANIGEEEAFRFHEFQYMGEAAYDNVEIRYKARKPDIRVFEGDVKLQVVPNRPEIAYQRGKLDIYMQQHAKVTITPPQIDATV